MNIFLSYPHADRTLAEQLQGILASGGHTIWRDDQLITGERWQSQLSDAISRADAAVLALTQNWLNSPYCQWEFVTAVEQGKKIIPVLLAPVSALPERLSQYQYADFQGGFADTAKVQRFLDDLLKLAVTVERHAIAGMDKQQYEATIAQQNSGGGHNFNVGGSGNVTAGGNIDQSRTSIRMRGSTVQGGMVNIGGKQEVHGSVTITMGNLTAIVGAMNAAEDEKVALQTLIADLEAALNQAPADQQNAAAEIARLTKKAVDEAAKTDPDQVEVKDRANLLKMAAENVKTALPLAAPIALNIVAHLLKFGS